MIGLTQMQAEMLAAIKRLTVDGVCPTYEELKLYLGLASKGQVHRLITCLEQRGAIRRRPGQARAIEVLDTSYTDVIRSIDGLDRMYLPAVAEFCRLKLEQRP